MICHGLTYSADVFRAAALPDESIRSILAYGAVNPGNDAFPKELFHGTDRFDLHARLTPATIPRRSTAPFWRTSGDPTHRFEVAAEFDMGNGYHHGLPPRQSPGSGRAGHYRRWLAEEDEQFPYNFSAGGTSWKQSLQITNNKFTFIKAT